MENIKCKGSLQYAVITTEVNVVVVLHKHAIILRTDMTGIVAKYLEIEVQCRLTWLLASFPGFTEEVKSLGTRLLHTVSQVVNIFSNGAVLS